MRLRADLACFGLQHSDAACPTGVERSVGWNLVAGGARTVDSVEGSPHQQPPVIAFAAQVQFVQIAMRQRERFAQCGKVGLACAVCQLHHIGTTRQREEFAIPARGWARGIGDRCGLRCRRFDRSGVCRLRGVCRRRSLHARGRRVGCRCGCGCSNRWRWRGLRPCRFGRRVRVPRSCGGFLRPHRGGLGRRRCRRWRWRRCRLRNGRRFNVAHRLRRVSLRWFRWRWRRCRRLRGRCRCCRRDRRRRRRWRWRGGGRGCP